MTPSSAFDRACAAYQSKYDTAPTLVVRAPGRVNLIGEHTDYNDGFVLPMALPFDVVIAGEPRDDNRVVAQSEGFDEIEFAITDPISQGTWETYVHGTAQMLLDSGFSAAGWQGCLASDIPAGASLSSSAALEVASGHAFVTAAGSSISGAELSLVGQRVENDVLGFPSGLMDQLASATSFAGAASLIDCRSLSTTPVELGEDITIVIMDTGTRRELVETEYAVRRAACETVARQLGIAALRDATLDQLDLISDELLRRRAQHVITENQRTLDAVVAIEADDHQAFGTLMNASHASLRDDYEVSGPALDTIVELAQNAPGCYGARMTGGGFAGATVALVATNAVDRFVDHILTSFSAPASQPSSAPVRLYPVQPAAGASVLARPDDL